MSVEDNAICPVAFALSVDVSVKTTVGPNVYAKTSCNYEIYQREKYWLDATLLTLSMIVMDNGGIIEYWILSIECFLDLNGICIHPVFYF